MKNVWGLIFLLLILTVLGFVAFTFQVRQTESALVTRFGEPVRAKTEPGLYGRLPIPEDLNDVHVEVPKRESFKEFLRAKGERID